MHGSTGAQLRICTVDPSGSRVVTRCIGVPVEQRRRSTTLNSSHIAAWLAVATLPSISRPRIAVDE